ncbi:MAG: transketolase C-terminal domain-containing protein [Sphaerochaetaceae bacterium]
MNTADPRKTFGEALAEIGKENSKVLAISADSSSGSGLGPFKKLFSERHIEFGIMEQGIIGYAAGLATTGKIPFVVAIAPFLTSRPFEMVRNDVGYMKQNVKIVGRCAGMSYADLGPTHHSLEDVAILRTIPGFTILVPSDPVEIKEVAKAAAELNGPVYIKIARDKMPIFNDNKEYKFELGKGVTLKEGNDLTIVATGVPVYNALEAANALEKKGLSVRVINIHTLKPIDKEIIIKAAKETGKIVTVEEHYLAGGLGSIVAEITAQHAPAKLHMVGVNDQFASNGPYDGLMAMYNLDTNGIIKEVESFLKN